MENQSQSTKHRQFPRNSRSSRTTFPHLRSKTDVMWNTRNRSSLCIRMLSSSPKERNDQRIGARSAVFAALTQNVPPLGRWKTLCTHGKSITAICIMRNYMCTGRKLTVTHIPIGETVRAQTERDNRYWLFTSATKSTILYASFLAIFCER